MLFRLSSSNQIKRHQTSLNRTISRLAMAKKNQQFFMGANHIVNSAAQPPNTFSLQTWHHFREINRLSKGIGFIVKEHGCNKEITKTARFVIAMHIAKCLKFQQYIIVHFETVSYHGVFSDSHLQLKQKPDLALRPYALYGKNAIQGMSTFIYLQVIQLQMHPSHLQQYQCKQCRLCPPWLKQLHSTCAVRPRDTALTNR